MGLFSLKKNRETRWICKNCTKEVTIKDVGAVWKENQIIIPTSGNCEAIAKDKVLCNFCAVCLFIKEIINVAEKEKRPLTVHELLSLEEGGKAKSYHEAFIKIKAREFVPDNSVRYNAMPFDDEGRLLWDCTCPKCSQEIRFYSEKGSINTIEQQIDYYMRMRKEKPFTCPTCKHNFILIK